MLFARADRYRGGITSVGRSCCRRSDAPATSIQMRIVYVSGNRESMPNAVIPIGLLYVMANTPERHEKRLVDLCFAGDPRATLRQSLRDFRPDVVAIGMRNIQNNEYSGSAETIAWYADLLRITRDTTDATIVLGGAGFSIMPGELMAHLRPDFGIAGEGERAFPALLEALDGKSVALDGIASLYYWCDGGLVANPAATTFLDLDGLRIPDRRLVAPEYYAQFGIDSVQTKRGCSLHCDYCVYPLIEGRRGRLRSAVSVVDEMFAAAEAQPAIDHFFIVDSVFNLPLEHAKSVCRELIRRRWTIAWSCHANPIAFDREFADLACEAGCSGLEIGSDSGSDKVLKSLKKGFRVEQVRRLHDICAAAGLPDCHSFILGTERETLDDARETLDFIVDLDPFGAIINIWFDDAEALRPALRAQRRQLRAAITDLLEERRDDYRHWSVPALGINFDEGLFRTLRRAGYRGPLWQHLRRKLPGAALRAATRPDLG